MSKLEGLIVQVASLIGNPVSTGGNEVLEQKMAHLLGQVQHLTAQMQEYQAPFTKGTGLGAAASGKDGSCKRLWIKFTKCQECDNQNKPICPHCRKCGKEGHKKSECKEKN